MPGANPMIAKAFLIYEIFHHGGRGITQRG